MVLGIKSIAAMLSISIVVVIAFPFIMAAIADTTMHGWRYVEDDGVCGTPLAPTDDVMPIITGGSAGAELIRFKWCIVGQQDTPSSANIYYSNTTAITSDWSNGTDPYYYPIGAQGSVNEKFRWADSSYLTHNDTAGCTQTDDHQPENGTVFEGAIASGFINQPSANNLCQEHEFAIEYLGDEDEIYQFVFVLNDTILANSGMHGKQGVLLQTIESTAPDGMNSEFNTTCDGWTYSETQVPL